MARYSFQQMDLDAKVTRWDLREASDLACARKIARLLLTEMAGQGVVNQGMAEDGAPKNSRNFSVVVRDEAGARVFEARRSLPSKRPEDYAA